MREKTRSNCAETGAGERCRLLTKLAAHASIGLALVLGGCAQNMLLPNQMTPDIVTSSTAQRAEGPARYFGAMCLRAGVSTFEVAQDEPRCDIEDVSVEEKWLSVVAAALNDIDERCDTYLHALDQARRDRTAFRRKLLSVSSATNIIVSQTQSNGAKALAIVEEAFGFVTGTMNNYYSRLILETDKSSVETLVRKLRNAYRAKFDLVTRGMIYGFPGSFYVVKGYLRLCLPATIEAEINSTIDSTQYDNVSRFTAGEVRNPLLAVLDAIPGLERAGSAPAKGNGSHGGGTQPPITDPPITKPPVVVDPDPTISPFIGATEQSIRISEARQIQRSICVKNIDGQFGRTGSETRRKIRIAKRAIRRFLFEKGSASEARRLIDNNFIGTQTELNFLTGMPDCPRDGSTFEHLYLLPKGATVTFHVKLQKAINTIVDKGGHGGQKIVLAEADKGILGAAFAAQSEVTPLTRKALSYIEIAERPFTGAQPVAVNNVKLNANLLGLIQKYQPIGF